MELLRSWIFVPGHRENMVDKALGFSADAVMLDIEDGVAPAEKESARKQIRSVLGRIHSAPGRRPKVYVRVNAVGHPLMDADLASVVRPGLEGVVLPKIESADQVKLVDELLSRREPEAGIPQGSLPLMILIESPRGLLNAVEVASASPRVTGLMFGAEDFGKQLGLPARREGEARDFLYVRSALVIAGAAARVQIVDGIWPEIKDTEGLQSYAVQSRRLGFTGMSLIHPGQIDVVNGAFSPTAEEVSYAESVIKAFEEGEARGDGVIALGGQLIDIPIVERARRTLSLAASLRK